jgi:hypothetical protein
MATVASAFRRKKTVLAILATVFATELHAQQPAAAPRQGRLFPPADLGLLESPDRAAWQKPDLIMDALKIAYGDTVADIGAGSGFFTVRLARRVDPRGENGLVYAEDIQQPMLESIKRRVSREGLKNVVTRLGTPTDAKLPTPFLSWTSIRRSKTKPAGSGCSGILRTRSSRKGESESSTTSREAEGRALNRNGVWTAPSSKRRSELPAYACWTAPPCPSSTS